jgi:small subunit ribosomal protein S1
VSDQTEPKPPILPEPQTTPDAPTSHEEFARLLASSSDPKRHAAGSVVKGKVVQIGETDILVDVGGKSEATIARAELAAEDGSLSIQVGDPIEATVVSTEGGVRLSRRMSASTKDKHAVKQMLIDASRNGVPVSGRVTASVKGGYEVQVSGVRGFCPFSQIDVRRQEDPTLYFHKTFDFLIKEYNPGKRNLVLSRRALIEVEQRKQEEEVRASITEGSVMKGTIVSLQDFGAFIELGGGIQGLLHVSEISHARVEKPSDLLSVGQSLDVQILKIDAKKKKISLTRKPLEGDPWIGVGDRVRQGQVITAKVMRVTDFGAFLEVLPGVDGLLHVSEMAAMKNGGGAGRNAKPQDMIKAGEELKVSVVKVDEARRRVSLGLATEKPAPGVSAPPPPEPPKVGETVKGKVERVEKFGVFIRLGPGRAGMIPNNELGTQRGADHKRLFPAGTELTAEVIEVDPAGRKIRLSLVKAMGREEREAVEKYRKDPVKSGGTSFSTLADAFNAMKDSPKKPS